MLNQAQSNPTENENAMDAPENLPALLTGEMKHGSVCDSASELGDTIDFDSESDCENQNDAVVNAGEEHVESIVLDDFDASGESVEVNVDDSQVMRTAKVSQTEFIESDSQPAEKRARFNRSLPDILAKARNKSTNIMKSRPSVVQSTSFAR